MDMKLGPVPKLDKRNKPQKNLTMTSCRKIVTSLSFFRFSANLEQFGGQIPDIFLDFPCPPSKRTPKKPTQIRVEWKSHLRAKIFGPNMAPIPSKSQINQYEVYRYLNLWYLNKQQKLLNLKNRKRNLVIICSCFTKLKIFTYLQ